MRLRMWKPPSGDWAGFANEIVKIVLGVLIALGAGEVVTAMHWRSEAASARRDLNAEVATSASYALDRLAIQPCMRDRLAALARTIQRPGRWIGDPLPEPNAGRSTSRAIPRVYWVPNRPWPGSAWESAISSGVLGHMNRDEVQAYSTIHRFVGVLRDTQAQEAALAPQLGALAYDQTLSDDRRAQVITTLAQLDTLNSFMTAASRQMLGEIGHVGLLRHPDLLRTVNYFPPIQRKLRGACVRLLTLGPEHRSGGTRLRRAPPPATP